MTRFLFLRVRAHRLLLAAALLAVVLTTAVLATLTAFAGAIGDAGLRHALSSDDSASASLVITAQTPDAGRPALDAAARRAASRTYDGLPVRMRALDASGPYGLPRGLQPPAARKGDPDLTQLAALDRSRVRLVKGSWPAKGQATDARGVAEVAVPQVAAERLKLKPGPAVLTLADRLNGGHLKIRVTGVYRPADTTDPYWQLDQLRGRGVRTDSFTTYGPLVADPALLESGKVSRGDVSWLATADFSHFTAGRIGALRATSARAKHFLAAEPVFKGSVLSRTSLPDLLDSAHRALLVARSTLLIVALQLVLLAGYALLLVARLLATDRTEETRLLLARGGSRGRIAALSALEALLLAVPAAVVAPLLAGPLTRMLGGQGALAGLGLRLDDRPTGSVWLAGGAAALACALAVALPALTARGYGRPGRAASLPGPVRAGADLGLLVIAGVAYWQLDRQTSGSGALSAGGSGGLSIDPLLVVAPALALLAGTVLTLRLLPPVARLAERRAARGRGLPAALAGWQLSRRPLRGAGPVLLLVLAVAMGVLAIGQGASWDASQSDQAGFEAGAPVRVVGSRTPVFGQGGAFAAIPGVRGLAPAVRDTMSLSGSREATVLALDTGDAAPGIGMRDDLAGGDAAREVAALHPADVRATGLPVPDGTTRLDLAIRLTADPAPSSADDAALGFVTLEDRYGVRYPMQLDQIHADGATHTLGVDLAGAAGAPDGEPAGPLRITGFEFDTPASPAHAQRYELTIASVTAHTPHGDRPVSLPSPHWGTSVTTSGADLSAQPNASPAKVTGVRGDTHTPLSLTYDASSYHGQPYGPQALDDIRVTTPAQAAPLPAALVTDSFASATGAKKGSVIRVPLGNDTLSVRVAGTVRQIPTTGPSAAVDGQGVPAATDSGAVLLDLRAVDRAFAVKDAQTPAPTEWWFYPAPGKAGQVAAALRERTDIDPGQILVRTEISGRLHRDPLGAGPQAALLAAAIAAAALAAVGFAVGTVAALRERSREFAVLRALGAPRRQLARLLAAEHSLLLGIGLAVGVVLGVVLTRAVVPLIVLTGKATQPVPAVHILLPAGEVVLLLAGVAVAPAVIVAALALHRTDPASSLRAQGGE
ncbi:FtsX-like permease family protein [Streptomyces sp. NRRL F-5126]|uniref:FtsX-like permease family protein n=1 Tax=Streptomyces sp. NRRL F-5126 TaxID=1463857 RepID=UPI0004CB47A7|nr:FtsX-like permease family protein [Streptomyces sp. NRRL F-5126]